MVARMEQTVIDKQNSTLAKEQSGQPVQVSLDGPIATLSLNRPEVHNAFNPATILGIYEAITALGQDPAIRAIILTGNGQSFSAGGDLNWMQASIDYTYEENLADAQQLFTMLTTLRTCPKPTIAKINGHAFGGGVGLVACCDMAIAVSHAKFSFSEVRLGLVPGTISPFVLEKIGPAQASRFFLTAERFTADTACQLGLIHRVASDEADLDTGVARWCEAICANGPEAIAHTKQLIMTLQAPAWQTQINLASEAIARARVSPEGQEGVTAFLEKRPPQWMTTVEEQ